MHEEITRLESALTAFGYGAPHCDGIKQRVMPCGTSHFVSAQLQYKAALTRTVAAKQKVTRPNATQRKSF